MAAVDTAAADFDGAVKPAGKRGADWRRRLPILLPAAAVGIVVLACFVVPLLVTMHPPTGGSVLSSRLPAGSPGHPLGTDSSSAAPSARCRATSAARSTPSSCGSSTC